MSRKAKDFTGYEFNGIKIIKRDGSKNNSPLWEAICPICGKTFHITSARIARGIQKSCGCAKDEMISRAKTHHGMSYTRQHNTWTSMKQRCDNPRCKEYKWYGAKGITYDPRWKNFDNFWADMKDGYADDLTLDRINVDGPYCKENCRWITPKEQCRNRHSNTFIDCKYGHVTVAEAAEKSGISEETLLMRLHNLGWYGDKLLTPVRPAEHIIDTPWGKMSETEAAKKAGITIYALRGRMKRNWPKDKWFMPMGYCLNGALIDTKWGMITLKEAAEKSGIPYKTLKSRRDKHWPDSRLFEPIHRRGES